jgi:hypothetical protein
VRVQIDFEIPNWTRWLVIGTVLGITLGYGAARVGAATIAAPTSWSKGDLLTAEALNRNFRILQDAIDAQQSALDALANPDCPSGYVRDPGVSNLTLCKRGADQVVKVGTGQAAFWIDRFEASVWSSPDGTGQQYGIQSAKGFPATFPINGQYQIPLYAVSQIDTEPSANLSWFQADAACEASAKHLPTREEWLRAARGTFDPGESLGTNGTCNTNSKSLRNTGAGTACVSRWGAEDMIGNVWEWTEEWTGSPLTDYPGLLSQWSSVPDGDGIWGLASVSFVSPDKWLHEPSAVQRGGGPDDGIYAGVFAMTVQNSPNDTEGRSGFRCSIRR